MGTSELFSKPLIKTLWEECRHEQEIVSFPSQIVLSPGRGRPPSLWTYEKRPYSQILKISKNKPCLSVWRATNDNLPRWFYPGQTSVYAKAQCQRQSLRCEGTPGPALILKIRVAPVTIGDYKAVSAPD